MISRYNGTCEYCRKPTKAGIDTYNVDEKISYHELCRSNVDALDESTAEIEGGSALADKLGFLPQKKGLFE